MISEATLPVFTHLDHEEIPVAMLCIIGFPEKVQAEIMSTTEDHITKVKASLRKKLGGFNSPNMGYHALEAGFNKDCTLNGKDIFTDEQKRKILIHEPTVQFRFAIGKHR